MQGITDPNYSSIANISNVTICTPTKVQLKQPDEGGTTLAYSEEKQRGSRPTLPVHQDYIYGEAFEVEREKKLRRW